MHDAAGTGLTLHEPLINETIDQPHRSGMRQVQDPAQFIDAQTRVGDDRDQGSRAVTRHPRDPLSSGVHDVSHGYRPCSQHIAIPFHIWTNMHDSY